MKNKKLHEEYLLYSLSLTLYLLKRGEERRSRESEDDLMGSHVIVNIPINNLMICFYI